MDVAPYTELQDFIDSLDVKDRKVEIETGSEEEKEIVITEEERRQDDIWQIIADAANDWSRRIVDAECLHARSTDFRSDVENSLYRQLLDGFLSISDAGELRHIANL